MIQTTIGMCCHSCGCACCSRAKEIAEINRKIDELVRRRNYLQQIGYGAQPFYPVPPYQPFWGGGINVGDVVKVIGKNK